MMTVDITAARIAALMEGVTNGPWTASIECGDMHLISADGESLMCDMTYYPWVPSKNADWYFIAAARDLVPALAARVAELERMVQNYSDACDDTGRGLHRLEPAPRSAMPDRNVCHSGNS